MTFKGRMQRIQILTDLKQKVDMKSYINVQNFFTDWGRKSWSTPRVNSVTLTFHYIFIWPSSKDK